MTTAKITPIFSNDSLWVDICEEARLAAKNEPLLSGYLNSTILNQDSLEDSVTHILADKLRCETLKDMTICKVLGQAIKDDEDIRMAIRADLRAFFERDPACDRYIMPLLYFKGFHALTAYRVTHWLWNNNRRDLALFLQNRISECFAVDIHPAANIGHGILIDHATSLVIGETSVIGNNVSMLHEVTLGGTGKDTGDRHPKVADGVLIGAGSKILGNVHIGEGAKVGAGSVVLDDVIPHCTVVGVPAIGVGKPCQELPALAMDHLLDKDKENQ